VFKHELKPVFVLQPTDIHLPSGLQYLLQYDGEGNLKMVRTPGLGKHFFSRAMLAGTQRYFYQVPSLELPYIEDYNGNGKLLQVIFPSEYRKVVYRYNNFALPTLVLYGDTEINIKYYPGISMISQSEVQGRGYRLVERYTYDSSLTDSYSVQFPDDYRLLHGKFSYVYDKNFRLIEIKSEFSKNLTMHMNYSFDDKNGFLMGVKSLQLEWPLVNMEKIYDEHVVISHEKDLYGRADNTRMVFRDNPRFSLNIVYDNMNRISSWSQQVGTTDTTSFTYTYDIDGNLIEVRQDGKSSWKYGYDNNGNINSVETPDKHLEMEYDVGDKIKTFGKFRYKFDEDGFMIQRHDEDLLFNSNGQLVSVGNSLMYKFDYYYDRQGRIVVQNDRLGNMMQYFYADTLRSNIVTHTYNHTNEELTQYFYDSKNKLIALERQGQLMYVALDPMGSPIVIYDKDGLIKKKLSYDPLGQVVADSNPQFELSFGFQGAIYNPVSKLSFIAHRVYDTMTGHFVNPDYSGMIRNLQHLTESPMMLNNFQYRHIVNTHLLARTFPTLGIVSLSVLSL